MKRKVLIEKFLIGCFIGLLILPFFLGHSSAQTRFPKILRLIKRFNYSKFNPPIRPHFPFPSRWPFNPTITPPSTMTPTLTPTNTPSLTLTPTPKFEFYEEFNESTLDTNLWEIFPNSGIYSLNNGFINIPGGNTPGMPFIRTKNNPFPLNGSFSIEFGIQYTNLFPAGNGLVLSDGQQLNNSTGPNIDLITIWNSNGGDGLHFAQYGTVKVILGINDLSYHIVKFIYDGEKYFAYLDGVLKYTSPLTNRASGLWFGHPYYSDLPGWTGLKIDYIKINLI